MKLWSRPSAGPLVVFSDKPEVVFRAGDQAFERGGGTLIACARREGRFFSLLTVVRVGAVFEEVFGRFASGVDRTSERGFGFLEPFGGERRSGRRSYRMGRKRLCRGARHGFRCSIGRHQKKVIGHARLQTRHRGRHGVAREVGHAQRSCRGRLFTGHTRAFIFEVVFDGVSFGIDAAVEHRFRLGFAARWSRWSWACLRPRFCIWCS